MPRSNEPLLRSTSDRYIGGVLGGISRFYGVDASVLRIATAILAVFYGTGVLAYCIAWVIMPSE